MKRKYKISLLVVIPILLFVFYLFRGYLYLEHYPKFVSYLFINKFENVLYSTNSLLVKNYINTNSPFFYRFNKNNLYIRYIKEYNQFEKGVENIRAVWASNPTNNADTVVFFSFDKKSSDRRYATFRDFVIKKYNGEWKLNQIYFPDGPDYFEK